MIRTCGAASSGWTSGFGLAIANTIASAVHPRQRLGRQHARAGDADQQVHAVDHVGGRARAAVRVGDLGEPALDRVHRAVEVVLALDVQGAAGVGADDAA